MGHSVCVHLVTAGVRTTLLPNTVSVSFHWLLCEAIAAVAVVSQTVCPTCNSRCVSGNSAQCCSADCVAGCVGGNEDECHVSYSILISLV